MHCAHSQSPLVQQSQHVGCNVTGVARGLAVMASNAEAIRRNDFIEFHQKLSGEMASSLPGGTGDLMRKSHAIFGGGSKGRSLRLSQQASEWRVGRTRKPKTKRRGCTGNSASGSAITQHGTPPLEGAGHAGQVRWCPCDWQQLAPEPMVTADPIPGERHRIAARSNRLANRGNIRRTDG